MKQGSDKNTRRGHLLALNALHAKPQWFEGQLTRIIEGETLFDLVQELKVSYGAYRDWIACDADREREFQKACRGHKDFVREQVFKTVAAIAQRRVQGKVNTSDILKAAEMVLNPKTDVTLTTGDGKITIVHESR